MRISLDSQVAPVYPADCVHGRVQPFHLGHLELAARAYELSGLLQIGIANSEPAYIAVNSAAQHRHRDENNPFPYYMRME